MVSDDTPTTNANNDNNHHENPIRNEKSVHFEGNTASISNNKIDPNWEHNNVDMAPWNKKLQEQQEELRRQYEEIEKQVMKFQN
jgi:hypothetical protein